MTRSSYQYCDNDAYDGGHAMEQIGQKKHSLICLVKTYLSSFYTLIRCKPSSDLFALRLFLVVKQWGQKPVNPHMYFALSCSDAIFWYHQLFPRWKPTQTATQHIVQTATWYVQSHGCRMDGDRCDNSLEFCLWISSFIRLCWSNVSGGNNVCLTWRAPCNGSGVTPLLCFFGFQMKFHQLQ